MLFICTSMESTNQLISYKLNNRQKLSRLITLINLANFYLLVNSMWASAVSFPVKSGRAEQKLTEWWGHLSLYLYLLLHQYFSGKTLLVPSKGMLAMQGSLLFYYLKTRTILPLTNPVRGSCCKLSYAPSFSHFARGQWTRIHNLQCGPRNEVSKIFIISLLYVWRVRERFLLTR